MRLFSQLFGRTPTTSADAPLNDDGSSLDQLRLGYAIDLLCNMCPAQNILVSTAKEDVLLAIAALGFAYNAASPESLGMHIAMQDESSSALISSQTRRLSKLSGLRLARVPAKGNSQACVREVLRLMERPGTVLCWRLSDFEVFSRVCVSAGERLLHWRPGRVVVVLTNPSAHGFRLAASAKGTSKLGFARKKTPLVAYFDCIQSATFFLESGILAPSESLNDFYNRYSSSGDYDQMMAALRNIYAGLEKTETAPFIDDLTTTMLEHGVEVPVTKPKTRKKLKKGKEEEPIAHRMKCPKCGMEIRGRDFPSHYSICSAR